MKKVIYSFLFVLVVFFSCNPKNMNQEIGMKSKEHKKVVYQVFTRLFGLVIQMPLINHGEPLKKTALENLMISQIKHYGKLKI